MNEQKAIQGGPTAIRGYLVQTLVALLKIAQSNPPFLEITLEPSHANEQFDFISQNQHGSDAVQVKSTINTFQKSEVEGWAKKLESERKNETCTLVLVGNYHTNLARINNIGAVRIEKKNLDIQGLIGEAAHLVAKFIESQKLYAGTADEREMITHSVISRLLQYSTTSETLKRETFIKLLAGWIRDAPSKIRLHGKQSNEIRNNLSSEWLRSGPPVAILQGLPGSGKTLLALAIAENAKRALDTIEPTVDTEDPSTDTLISLASAFSGVGISDLMQEVEKGRDGQPFKVLLKLLRNEDILIVIDEFQRLFFKGKTIPSIDWQKLVEQLNSSNRPNGRLMLISNRAVKTERWCERCVIREVKPLSDTEAGSYLCEQLEEKGVTSKVPPERLQEIGGRMGGNPRAIATLAESLTFDSLEDLLSMSPAIFTTGDVEINHALVEDFERGLIERTLSRIEKDLLHSLRQLSVHRRPFKKEAYIEVANPGSSIEDTRKQLISRFLLINVSGFDTMHPLAREVSVTRLRENALEWKKAHGFAANYQLRHFKAVQARKAESYAISFAELRHHLFEAKRIEELYQAGEKFARFTLSQIPDSTYSKVPESVETLEERIALISALPEESRTRGLSYHLALCLKHRNKGHDYQNALINVRRAVEPKAYYAVWLLLIELEYALNGIDAMMTAKQEALKFLGSGSNAFAVYHLSANLLGKEGKTDLAIEVLENGLSTPGIKCISALASLCSTFKDRSGRLEEAIRDLEGLINTPAVPRLWELYVQCARLLEKANRTTEAVALLGKGIATSNIKALHNLYLLLAELLAKDGDPGNAIQQLKNGISDNRVYDKVDVYCACADLIAKYKSPKAAISLLEEGILSRLVDDPVPLFHRAAAIFEDSGDPKEGINFLKRGMLNPNASTDASLYLVCAKQLFRLMDVDGAVKVLKQGLTVPKMRHKDQLYHMCADFIVRQGRLKEAIALLEDGIEDSDHPNAAYLYQKGSELLDKAGQLNEAIEVLLKGINASALSNKVVLFQGCAKLMDKAGRTSEGITLIERALRAPGITGLANLYQTGARLLTSAGRQDEAIDFLMRAINDPKVGNILSLYHVCIDLMLASGDLDRASALLEQGIAKFPSDIGLTSLQSRASSLSI